MTQAPPLDNGKTMLGLKKILDLKFTVEGQLADLQVLYETLEGLQDQAVRLEPNLELIAQLEERLSRKLAAAERSRELFVSVLSS
jgi:hypothetical protein